MREEYVLLERNESMGHKIAKYAVVVCAVLLVVANFFMPVFILLPIILAVIAFFMFRSYTEFEYSYFDGDFKFYRIKNKSRRKKLKTFDIEHVSAIAPREDRSMYRYTQDGSVKKVDYTSGMPDRDVYGIVVNDEEQTMVVWIEPDEKFLDAICYKNAQKVTRKK